MRTLIILIVILFPLKLTAPAENYIVILQPNNDPIEALWKAVCIVESNNNPLAVGDKHLKNHSYGISQIRESRLKEFNKLAGKSYTVNDLFNPDVSQEIFYYYAVGSYEEIARRWNGGINGMNKKSTENYWKLILKKL